MKRSAICGAILSVGFLLPFLIRVIEPVQEIGSTQPDLPVFRGDVRRAGGEQGGGRAINLSIASTETRNGKSKPIIPQTPSAASQRRARPHFADSR
jgi:hypothetical protein